MLQRVTRLTSRKLPAMAGGRANASQMDPGSTSTEAPTQPTPNAQQVADLQRQLAEAQKRVADLEKGADKAQATTTEGGLLPQFSPAWERMLQSRHSSCIYACVPINVLAPRDTCGLHGPTRSESWPHANGLRCTPLMALPQRT
jgi:hypothetical protein